MLKRANEEGFILSGSTPGEDRWSDPIRPEDEILGLVPGHSYSIIKVMEAEGHKLLNIRNIWTNFEWKGDWSSNSKL